MESNLNSTFPENCDNSDINVLLKGGLQAILETPRLRKLKLAFTDPELQISIDLKVINEKIAKSSYSSLDEFVADLKRMEGNEDLLLNKKELLRPFKDFLKYCNFDLKLIKSCAGCYWNELMDETDDWFTESCSKPHPVAMVKFRSSTYTPAKILNFDEKNVFVRLFGELGVAEIPYGDRIQLYTKYNSHLQKQQRKSMKAIQAANLYIENIIKKFGFYNYGDIQTTTTTLTLQRLSQHLQYLTSPELKRRELWEDDRLEDRMAKRAKLGSHSDSEDDDSEIDVLSTRERNDSVECMPTVANNETAAKRECQSTVSSDAIRDIHPMSKVVNSDTDVQLSTVGSDKDDRRNENDSVERVSTSATRTSKSSVSIQRITSSTMIAVQQSTNSPPLLRDCSSRCGFASKDHEINALRNELEKIKSDHQIEMASMTKSYVEMMKQMRRQHESEQAAIVQETKTKQWCANCWQEAKLYCCWLTSYCDEVCQNRQWLQHRGICSNEQHMDNNGTT